MISIVIPLYDKAGQVKNTLTAVRNQIFTNYEVIIVDDGSTDGSLDIVRDYLKNDNDFSGRVRVFGQPHAGVSAARNKAIHESRFDWIAFLDADDTWEPEYLQIQYDLSLKYPFCEVLAAAYGFNFGAGKFVPGKFSKLPFRENEGELNNYFEVAACSHPPLSSITTIARKKAILAAGCFPEGISSGEDLLTWAKLALNCRIAFNKRSLGVYNQDPKWFNRDQQTRMPPKKDIVGDCLKKLLHQHSGIPGLKQYVGLWHKMRARIFLTHSMRKEAWEEWRQLVQFSPGHYKTWAYFLLLISPVKVWP
ncbi:glycosyltransferase family 2 protein [Flavitalea flava]